jgi:cytochrome c-type biogenesis protein CcmF
LVVAVCALIVWLTSKSSVMSVVGLTLALWILLGTGLHLFERLRHAPVGTSLFQRITRQPRSYWGMIVAHAGIGIFVIGVTVVKSFDVSNDVSMRVGDTTSAAGYDFHFVGLQEIKGPNYVAAQGRFEVSKNGQLVNVMQPEKRFYTVQQMPMTEAAIDRGFTRDLYVSLGEATKDGAWLVRVQHKPFIGWIWAGCLIIAFGGFLAASDRRYRLSRKQKKHVDETSSNVTI